ncbi:hypothetical protein HMPREF0574_0197 [Mobiluncus curtisii subsp. curtisii ATCC 35241]|uniref:Uncharacterized protein n=1 Tax=Mobiluncus curtisii (strain ATCC 43063 / DSM 2711 / V125) TaxID=548479 RepID=D6ZHC4_MOBCV|nr:hypothetical protein HMPREF0573_11713 [Mobiluncus curtisii ATCC 43063]EFL94501.1 hypothetical protein HMPREF0574_0197 [Mobiluncus curtisii subsp. curtisii ATCC 35241]
MGKAFEVAFNERREGARVSTRDSDSKYFAPPNKLKSGPSQAIFWGNVN